MHCDYFLDTISKVQSMKEITDKLNYIKIKNFCSSKTLFKTEDRERKKYLHIHI